jgi:hypothetical protein
VNEATSTQDALAAAEKELDALSEQTRAAYRAYRAANDRQDAKIEEIRELARQVREESKP